MISLYVATLRNIKLFKTRNTSMIMNNSSKHMNPQSFIPCSLWKQSQIISAHIYKNRIIFSNWISLHLKQELNIRKGRSVLGLVVNVGFKITLFYAQIMGGVSTQQCNYSSWVVYQNVAKLIICITKN